jgi:heme oxygenase (staphylobilin-producing)
VYFKDKKAYYLWEGSPEHIASHKKPQEKPEGILNIEHLTYEVVQIDHYEGI